MADEWKVGDEVALVARYGGGYTGRTSKVAKIYQNGNVLIESERTQQFRPVGDARLHQTGDTRYGRNELWVRVTAEVRLEVAAKAAADRALAVVQAMIRNRACAAHIDALNAFLAAVASTAPEGL